MTKEELWDHNVGVLNNMNTAAGSVIKQLLVDLKSADNFIKLEIPESHRVKYSIEEGDQDFIEDVAEELGISVVGGELVVPHD